MENNRRDFIKAAAIVGLTAASGSLASFAKVNKHVSSELMPIAGKFELPALGFGYDALEPFIDAKTMEIHYSKHHQAYVNKLNDALDKHPDLKTRSLESLLRDLKNIPDAVRMAVRNQGGGHYNHTFFWALLRQGTNPGINTMKHIQDSFGSIEVMKTEFAKAATGVFGSGWAWMIVKDGKLKIVSTPNQDNPLMDIAEVKGKPVFAIDVWEHAYYLKYQNKRADYVTAFWNVLNWDQVELNLNA